VKEKDLTPIQLNGSKVKRKGTHRSDGVEGSPDLAEVEGVSGNVPRGSSGRSPTSEVEI